MSNLCQRTCYNKTELGYCKSTVCLFHPISSIPMNSVTVRTDVIPNPRTNGDRLRSLPDEELAKVIARKITGCYGCPATNELECAECVLEWLRKEADA